MKLSAGDIFIIVFAVIAVAGVALFFLNRWASKRSVEQQSVIQKNKQSADIFVIDKRKDKAANVNLPKAVVDQLPRMYKMMKLHFVKAKVGPQIVTLMCDKPIFNMLQPKKNYRIELAGLTIVSVKGMKSAYELKQAAEQKKAREKAEKKAAKDAAKSPAKSPLKAPLKKDKK